MTVEGLESKSNITMTKICVEHAIALSDRRLALCKNPPTCPRCGEKDQIQLLSWDHRYPALWRCRTCKHPWHEETI